MVVACSGAEVVVGVDVVWDVGAVECTTVVDVTASPDVHAARVATRTTNAREILIPRRCYRSGVRSEPTQVTRYERYRPQGQTEQSGTSRSGLSNTDGDDRHSRDAPICRLSPGLDAVDGGGVAVVMGGTHCRGQLSSTSGADDGGLLVGAVSVGNGTCRGGDAALVAVAVSLGWLGVGRGLGLVGAGLDVGVDAGQLGEGG